MKLISRILLAFVAGTAVFAVIVGIAMFIEEPLQMPMLAYSFAPGLVLKQFLESFGPERTNRFAVWATLAFWWAVAFIVIDLVGRRRLQR